MSPEEVIDKMILAARPPRHVYLISLEPTRTVRVSADYFSISSGILSLGIIGKDEFIAYAPGAWSSIVQDGVEVERL